VTCTKHDSSFSKASLPPPCGLVPRAWIACTHASVAAAIRRRCTSPPPPDACPQVKFFRRGERGREEEEGVGVQAMWHERRRGEEWHVDGGESREEMMRRGKLLLLLLLLSSSNSMEKST
jgi:hypothetical protein